MEVSPALFVIFPSNVVASPPRPHNCNPLEGIQFHTSIMLYVVIIKIRLKYVCKWNMSVNWGKLLASLSVAKRGSNVIGGQVDGLGRPRCIPPHGGLIRHTRNRSAMNRVINGIENHFCDIKSNSLRELQLMEPPGSLFLYIS